MKGAGLKALGLLQAMVDLVLLAGLASRVARFPRGEPTQPAGPGIQSTGSQDLSYRHWRRLIVGTILSIIAIGITVWFVVFTRAVLVLFAISIVLAVAIRPTVDRMSSLRIPGTRRTIPRPLSILLIYLALAVAAAGIGLAAVPPIVSEIQKLIASLPDYLAEADRRLQGLQQYLPVPNLSTLESQLFNQLLGNLTQAVNVVFVAVDLLTGLLSIGVVLVFTFFLIVDADLMYEHFTRLLPASKRERADEIAAKMSRKIEGWLKGTIMLAIILGAVTTAAMYVLGMPYPYLLGLAAGIFELMPILGPYLGAAPAVIVALFSGSVLKIVAVVLFFILIQQLENNVLAPNIFGRHAELPPLLIILGLLFGGSIYGIIGALLAVPAAAIAQVLWLEVVVPEIERRRDKADQLRG